MRAAGIGIVDHEDIAGVHVTLEYPNDVLTGVVQRADVDGDVLVALRDGIAVGVIQRGGEIAVVDDEGIARPQDLLRHLIDGGDKRVLENFEGDGVEGKARSGVTHFEASVM